MKKTFRKFVSLLIVVATLAGIAVPAYATFEEVEITDYISLSSAVINGRTIAVNRHANGQANLMGYDLYDYLYRGENAIIHAELPTGGRLQIAVYSYEDILNYSHTQQPGLTGQFPTRRDYSSSYNHSEPPALNSLPYHSFSPNASSSCYNSLGRPFNAIPRGYLTGYVDGVEVTFDNIGVQVDNSVTIEWSGAFKEAALSGITDLLLVFSFVPNEGTSVNPATIRTLPLKMFNSDLHANNVKNMQIAYGNISSASHTERTALVPLLTIEEQSNWWHSVGALNLDVEDIRIEGANPLVFKREYNSKFREFRTGGTLAADANKTYNRGLGYWSEWTHNYYYRLEMNHLTDMVTVYLPLDGSTAAMKWDSARGYYRVFNEDTGDGQLDPNEWTLHPVGSPTQVAVETNLDMYGQPVYRRYNIYYDGYMLKNSVTGQAVLFAVPQRTDINHVTALSITNVFLPYQIIEANGSKTTITHNPPAGTDSAYFYNAFQAMVTQVENSSGVLTFSYTNYNSSGHRGSAISKIMIGRRDSNKNIVYENDASVSYVYNAKGLLTSFTNLDGIETRYTYEPIDSVYYHHPATSPGESAVSVDEYGNALIKIDCKDGNDWKTVSEFTYINKMFDTDNYHWGEGRSHKYANYLIESRTDLGITERYEYKSFIAWTTGTNKNDLQRFYNVWTSVSKPGTGTTTYYNKKSLPVLESKVSSASEYDYEYRESYDNYRSGKEYIYDRFNRLTDIIDETGNTTQYLYDDYSDNPPQTGAAFYPTNRILYIMYSDSNYERIGYNNNGQITRYAKITPEGIVSQVSYYHYYDENSRDAGKLRYETFGKDCIRFFLYDISTGYLEQVDEYEQYDPVTMERIGSVKRRVYYENDSAGRPVKETDMLGGITEYEYNLFGKVTRITTPESRVRTYEYSNAGQMLKENYLYRKDESTGTELFYTMDYSYDYLGNVTGYTNWYHENVQSPVWTTSTVNTEGLTSSITGAGVVDTYYEYSTLGEIAKVTTPGNGYDRDGDGIPDKSSTQYTYDVNGRVLSTTDPMGNVTTYAYDTSGNLISEVKPNKDATVANWDSNNNFLGYGSWQQGESNSATRMFAYNSDKQVVSEIQGSSSTNEYGTIHYTYDKWGNLSTMTDARGNVTDFEYDWEGRLLQVTTPEKMVTEYEYNLLGWLVRTTTSKNKILSTLSSIFMEYDNDGLLIRQVDSENNTTLYTYDLAGNLTRVTYPDNTTVDYGYDANRNVVSINDRNYYNTSYGFDAANRITSIREPGQTTTFTYTGNGNVASQHVNYRDQNTIFNYDNNDNLIEIIDPNGAVTTNTYDSLNRLVTTTDGEGNTTEYSYDSGNNMTKIKRANGGVTLFIYDGMGRMTEERTLADEQDGAYNIKSYEYDNNSNLTKETDARGNTTSYFYDKDNRLIEVRPRDYNPANPKSRVLYRYDDEGNLGEVENMDGIIKYEYSLTHLLTKITTPLGYITTYEYDSSERLINESYYASVTALNAKNKLSSISYTYDGNGNVSTKTDANENDTFYYYDGLNRLIRISDPRSNTYTIDYGNMSNNYAQKETNQNNETTVISYDPNGNIISVTDARGNATEFSYDNNNRVTDMLVSLGNQEDYLTTYEYNTVGNLTKVINPNNAVISMEYSVNDLLIKETDALNNTILRDYDENGNLIKLTDRNGNVTEYQYDKEDRMTKTISYLDKFDKSKKVETVYEYDYLGRIVSMTDALNNTSNLKYDSEGRLAEEANPLSTSNNQNAHRVKYAYDARGNVTRLTYEDESYIDLTYDSNGNVKTKTDELGLLTTYTYNAYDLLIEERVTYGSDYGSVATTRYTYTPTGLVQTVTNPDGGITSYEYDENGNVTKVTDPETNKTEYDYDVLNRPIWERQYNSSAPNANPFKITGFAYDGNNNVKEISHYEYSAFAQNRRQLLYRETFTFDLNDQVTGYSIISADGQDSSTTGYVYDANGNVTRITDPKNNSREIEYDALNRATKFTNEIGVLIKENPGNQLYAGKAGSNNGVVLFEYDALGRVIRSLNEDNAETRYEYDAKGRLKKTTDALGNSRVFDYDSRDRVISEKDENGVTRRFAYDNAGNITKKTTNTTSGSGTDVAYEETFTYDKRGNMLTYTDRNGEVTSYSYDSMSRVTRETNPLGGITTFGYDKNGRITSVTDENGVQTQYAFDANGNIVETKERIDNSTNGYYHTYYTYDAMNRLIKVATTNTNGGTTPQTLSQYIYDYRGLVKVEIDALGIEKTNKYDANGNLTEVWWDEDGFAIRYTYNEVNLIVGTEYSDGKSVQYAYNGTGELVRFEDWTGVTTYERDALNRITQVRDPQTMALSPSAPSSGVIKYGYDGLGNTTSIKYPGTDGKQVDYYYNIENRVVEMIDSEDGRYRFSYDPEGNLLYTEYPNRETSYNYYDALGRLIQTDDYSPSGLNTFSTAYEWDPVGNLLSETEYGIVVMATVEHVAGIAVPDAGAAVPDAEIPQFDLDVFRITAIEASGKIHSKDYRLSGDMSGVYTFDGYEFLVGEKKGDITWECSITSTNSGERLVGYNPRTDGSGGYLATPVISGIARKPKPQVLGYSATIKDAPEQIDQASATATKTSEFSYNSRNAMTMSTVDGVSTTYEYDAKGNLTTEQSGGADGLRIEYDYNNINQLINKREIGEANTSITTFAYDIFGNMTRKTSDTEGTETYVYDLNNHMTKATTGVGISEYKYNALGMRVKSTQTTAQGQSQSKDYVIDHTNAQDSYRNDLMVSQTTREGSASENFSQLFVYLGDKRLEQVTTQNGEIVSLLYIHEDLRGTSRRYTNEDGSVYAQIEYSVWGEPLEITGNDEWITLNFAGHEYDPIAGLFHAQARFFDAENRIWASADPAKQNTNWYRYCGDNPTSCVDPTGYFFLWNWIKKAFKAIWKAIKWVGNAIIKGLEIAWDWISGAVSDIANAIADAAKAAWNFLSEVTSKIWEGVKTAADWVVKGLKFTANWVVDNIGTILIVAGTIAITVASGGTALPALVSLGVKYVMDAIAVYVPSATLDSLRRVVDIAASIITGDWTEIAKTMVDAVVKAAIKFASEQIAKAISKIEALQGLVRSLITFALEADWGAIAEELMDKGLSYITERVDYVTHMVSNMMDYLKNVDIGELLSQAGQHVVDYVSNKIDEGVNYVTSMVSNITGAIDWVSKNGFDYAVNYIVQKGEYIINYADNLINQGVDIFTNSVHSIENTLTSGFNKVLKDVSKVVGRAEGYLSNLSKLPGMIAGRVEPLVNQLPSAAMQLANKAVTLGQHVLVAAVPIAQTYAQQTLSRHMERIGKQILGHPPFTTPNYSYA